jgi:hypothetical protein
VLPRDVARFYLRALAAAVSAGDASTLTAVPAPPELLAVLGVARGCDRVIELGRDDPVTPVALAIDDARRQVTAFRPADGPAAGRYAGLAAPSTRARVNFRTRPLEHMPVDSDHRACLALVDGSSDHRRVALAFEAARGAVRPGGLVVFRRHGHPSYGGVGEAIAALALDGRSLGQGLYLWRKPVEEPPRLEAAKPRRRVRVPWLEVALALVGIAIGIGAGVLVTRDGGNDETLVSTTTAPTAQAPGQRSSPPDARTSRPARRSRAREERRSRARTERRARRTRRERRTGARGRGAYQFSGNGLRTLDTVRIRRDSILRWSTQGGSFGIKSSSFELNASAQSGQTTIPRGTYHRLRVRASTPWTLQIAPR